VHFVRLHLCLRLYSIGVMRMCVDRLIFVGSDSDVRVSKVDDF
jgi:hypothetical protein